ncbi:histone acetyltransferase type B catalytic subunit [Kockovaella imperatae]|uniref:Histone acetyltransferase type B catalytic subunit n=1 Tax=Kockovaella imperatae TaxID=4999 RepID=A0A1Y1UFI8_9TREE|nr:histone acetyltransferase type B catalytic subunit [Kockovaella imperatae]ORX36274.1 histone acetyltransferase type B catalytic subunit [Kockovaella imperatae]
MSSEMEEWLCDSNDALSLSLIRAPEDKEALHGDERKTVAPFHPAFTYPIYGEQEKIFGYKGLEIRLSFASGSLKQMLDISYDSKLDSEATPADDVEGKLYQFIPPDYSKSSFSFEQTVDDDASNFKPLGEKIGSYARPSSSGTSRAKGKGKGKANGAAVELKEDDPNAVVYEMYKSTWNTTGFREYHRRMQLFILLFIEGGSYIQEDEDAWEFITLFEKRRRADTDLCTYHFVGYTSVYPFWCFPDQVRLRLSQFVILPPYQSQGHGSKLYNALYLHALSRKDVAELTVEDPAEAFEDLRDRCDLRYLVSKGILDDPGFSDGVGADVRGPRAKWEEKVRKEYKIAQRQFDRVLEMLLLRELDEKDPAKVKAFRLGVKARLYRFNYEMLSQMTLEERKDALAKTYESVVQDYRRILAQAFH